MCAGVVCKGLPRARVRGRKKHAPASSRSGSSWSIEDPYSHRMPAIARPSSSTSASAVAAVQLVSTPRLGSKANEYVVGQTCQVERERGRLRCKQAALASLRFASRCRARVTSTRSTSSRQPIDERSGGLPPLLVSLINPHAQDKGSPQTSRETGKLGNSVGIAVALLIEQLAHATAGRSSGPLPLWARSSLFGALTAEARVEPSRRVERWASLVSCVLVPASGAKNRA